MLGALGTPATADTHPIAVRTDDHADAAAGLGGPPPAHPAAITPHEDDDSDVDDDAAAPPPASARSGTSSPVDDDTGLAPGREVAGAAPVGEALCHSEEDRGRGDGNDDVDMGLDDAPDSSSAPPGNTGPLASHDEDDGGLAADERSSVEDSHGDTVMGQDGDRVVAVTGQPLLRGARSCRDGEAHRAQGFRVWVRKWCHISDPAPKVMSLQVILKPSCADTRFCPSLCCVAEPVIHGVFFCHTSSNE